MRMRSKQAPGGKRRWMLAAGVGLLAVCLAWLFFWRSAEPVPTAASHPVKPEGTAVARSSWDSGPTAAPSEARGSRSIRGRVVGPEGPVPGALVVALTRASPEWLALLPPDELAESTRWGERCGQSPYTLKVLELAAERRREETPPLARATTDAQGHFRLEGLEQGSFVLWAERGEDVGIQWDVASGREDAELRMASGHSFRGVVRDERGEAVAGARVMTLLRELGRVVETSTDAKGRFALGPFPWSPSTVLVSKEGFPPWSTSWRDWRVVRSEQVLVLGAFRRLSGHVLDERGPVRGATVRVEYTASIPPVTTDARGYFAFEGLCRGHYLVAASHEGRQAEQASNLWREPEPVELVLRAGLHVRGHVTTPRGGPIEGAEVSVSWGSPTRSRTVRTDSGGRFQIGPLAPGTYGMSVRAERYVPEEVPPRLIEASEEVRVQLKEALMVEGRTVNEAGAPVEGVSLRLMRAGDGASGTAIATARSGADGVFALEAPAPGPYRVVAAHPDFVTEELPVSAPSREARVSMRGAASIEVELVDDGGRLLPQMDILLQHQWAVSKASTNAEGRAVFRGLEPGSYRVKAEIPRGWTASSREEVVEVRGVEAREVRLSLGGLEPWSAPPETPEAWSEVRGRVVYEDGRPVVSFLVAGEQVNHPEGRFSVKISRYWQRRLAFSEPGFDDMTYREVDPRESKVIELGDVVLEESRMVHGRVLEAGTLVPIAGARVQGAKALTRQDGSFTVRVAQPRPLRVSHPDYLEANVLIEEGQREVTVVLEPGARLEGRVTSAGVPVHSGLVHLRSEQGVLLATTGFWEGRYAMRTLNAGRYLVQVVAPTDEGPAPIFPVRQVELTPNGRATVDFEPVAGASVEVFVPERNIEVHLFPGNLPLLGPKQGLYSKLGSGLMGRVVREGVRAFPQVPAGHYTLFAMRRDEDFTEVHREELEVPAGGQLSFPLLPLWSRFDD